MNLHGPTHCLQVCFVGVAILFDVIADSPLSGNSGGYSAKEPDFNTIGILFGQLIGDRIVAIRTSGITEYSTPKDIYYAHEHYGVFIWILFLISSFAVGICFKEEK